MKRFSLAAISTLMVVGLAMAEEFTLQITKISDDGTTVTGKKIAMAEKGKGKGIGKGGFGKGEEVTVKVASSVQVFKGKYDAESKSMVKEGDDLKLVGLKDAIMHAEYGNVMVDDKALTDKDMLELSMKNGKPAAKLNGKEVDFSTVRVTGKGALNTRVTTNDDGSITTVLITGGGFGGGFGKKKTDK